MITHYKRLIVSLTSVLALMSLAGCSSMMSSRMPKGSISMAQTYNEAINGTGGMVGSGTLKAVRSQVKNLKRRSPDYSAYTRTQENDINSQFPQLPNPSVVMYVYPHEAGGGVNLTPVPGYSTVFPLYQHVYYAMPGEIDTQ
jgi:conjugative transfer region lipoprotein (TIGR03751 family)